MLLIRNSIWNKWPSNYMMTNWDFKCTLTNLLIFHPYLSLCQLFNMLLDLLVNYLELSFFKKLSIVIWLFPFSLSFSNIISLEIDQLFFSRWWNERLEEMSDDTAHYIFPPCPGVAEEMLVCNISWLWSVHYFCHLLHDPHSCNFSLMSSPAKVTWDLDRIISPSYLKYCCNTD